MFISVPSTGEGMAVKQIPPRTWPSGSRWAIATLAFEPDELARRYGLVFEEGWDELDYYQRAVIDLPGVGQVWFLRYPYNAFPGTPIWVDAQCDFDAARRLVLAALELTPAAFNWVSPYSRSPDGRGL
jgi:hypothetical protein